MSKAGSARQAGFTLVELMIAVLIVGILAAIAVPAYQDYVFDSRRSSCAAALTGLAQHMERHYTENTSYEEAAAGGANTGAPATYSDSCPVDGGSTEYYDLRITAATQSAYTLQAQPKNVQSDDKCGTLTMNQAGNRGITNADSGVTVDECW